MDLPIPPEPVELKESMRKRRALDPIVDIDRDAAIVWDGNRLPSYLWRYWKDPLEKVGYNWQRFVKVLKYETDAMIDWALYDELSWSEFVKRLIKVLEKYSGRG